jgi:DNA-binding NarL/FixJ family response regulator
VARTVFIADAQAPFRAGLRAVLEAAGSRVVGEAADARVAVDAVADLRPDVCLIGSDDSAVLITKRLASLMPAPRIVVFAERVSADGLLAVVRAGASGYLPRDTSAAAIVRVVEAVSNGEYAIPRLGLTELIDELRGDGRTHIAIGGVPVSLTEREAQVVRLLVDGLKTEEIASSLRLSPITVRRYVGAIGAKAGRLGRRQLLQALLAA